MTIYQFLGASALIYILTVLVYGLFSLVERIWK